MEQEQKMGTMEKVATKTAIEAVDLAPIPLAAWEMFDLVTRLSAHRLLTDSLIVGGGFVLSRWFRRDLAIRARKKGVDLGQP